MTRIKKSGLTLYEVMVTIAITSILLVLIANITISMRTTYKKYQYEYDANLDLELIVERIDTTIRSYYLAGLSVEVVDQTVIVGEEQVLSFRHNQLIYKIFQQDENYLTFHSIDKIEFILYEGLFYVDITLTNQQTYRKLIHQYLGVEG